MNNRIRISIEFWFRGERINPMLELNLDELMRQHGRLPEFHPLLAKANQIGNYSYEYEMLEAETLTATALSGWVSENIVDQMLDTKGFEQRWHQKQRQQQMLEIAHQHQLPQDQNTFDALEAAFQLGQNKNNN
ncbi:MAG: hypothetical protein GXP11_01420 [Gammaproteobacteria bacterium]|nr:hypothetical protein [Gammaproteobacteria bacterium]